MNKRYDKDEVKSLIIMTMASYIDFTPDPDTLMHESIDGSLDFMEFIYELENQFDINVDLVDFEEDKTLEETVELVYSLQGKSVRKTPRITGHRPTNFEARKNSWNYQKTLPVLPCIRLFYCRVRSVAAVTYRMYRVTSA